MSAGDPNRAKKLQAAGLMIVLGVGMAAGGAWWAARRVSFLARAERAVGKVARYETSLGKNSRKEVVTFHRAVVEFEAGGRKLEVRASTSSATPEAELGAPAPVLYLPDDPREARLATPAGLWAGPALLLVLGSLSLLGGWGLIRHLRRATR